MAIIPIPEAVNVGMIGVRYIDLCTESWPDVLDL